MLHWSTEAQLWDTLASTLDAGLPPDRALVLAGEAAGGRPARQARQAAPLVSGGTPLAEALATAGVDPLACAVVRAGDHAGRLPPLLRTLAESCRLRARLRDEAVSRLVYPVLLLHVAPALLPLPWVVAGKLPAWTMLLGPLLLWLAVGGAAFAAWWSGRAGLLARLALAWPCAGLCRPALAADLAAVLRAAFGAGMLAPDALELASGACANRIFAARLAAVARELRDARLPDLATALAGAGLAGDLLEQVRSGELSGRLDQALEQMRVIASERFAWRLQWTARVATGTIYTFALLIAAATVFAMYWQTMIEPMRDAMKGLE